MDPCNNSQQPADDADLANLSIRSRYAFLHYLVHPPRRPKAEAYENLELVNKLRSQRVAQLVRERPRTTLLGKILAAALAVAIALLVGPVRDRLRR